MGYLTLTVKGKSAWDFVTSGSTGFSVKNYATEGGMLVMKNPSSNKDENFYYGGIGVGLSKGFKVSGAGIIEMETKAGALTASGAPTILPSTGILYTTDNCSNGDLNYSDFLGPCAFCEVNATVFGGVSACAMIVGMDRVRMLAMLSQSLIGVGAASNLTGKLLIASAKGVLFMAGVNLGFQSHLGGAVYIGELV